MSSRRDNHFAIRRSGFTIAEVLVAILITSIVAGIIYGSYMGGLKIIYDSQQDMERTHMASLILDRVTSDLACAFLRPSREYLFFMGAEGGEGEYPSDSVTFTSSHHEREGRDARESTLSIVSYYLEPGENDELFILRREDPRLDDDPFSGGEPRVIGEGIAGLKFDYNGEEGWTSSWDSRENSSLPTAVRVKLIFRTEAEVAGGAEEGEEAKKYTTFVTETALPAGGDWEEKEEESAAEQQKK